MDAPPHRLAVFGGTGATGRLVIQEALDRGIAVTVLRRPASTLGKLEDSVTVVKGSLQDERDVEETLLGCHSVICAFGARPPFEDLFCARSTRLILKGMQRLGVRRIMTASCAVVGEAAPGLGLPYRLLRWVLGRKLSAMMQDRGEQEELVEASDFDWTIIKPPRLVNTAGTDHVRFGWKHRMDLASKLTRVDLARFMIEGLEDESLFGRKLLASN